MTTTDTFQPRLRADLVFGPKALSGGKTVYYLKDTYTKWYYRIGIKEHFLMSRMDGSRTLQQLGAEYEAQFGRSLDERAWEGLFQMLDKRQLLADATDVSRLETLKREAERKRQQENSGLLRRRFPLLDPDTWLGKLLPWLRFAYRPVFVLPALLAIVGVEVFVLLHLPGLLADVKASYGHLLIIIPLFIALTWLIAALHETAHGLTCKRFGGSVQEMGIFWRYLSFFPYCKLDDVVLFHQRQHRVYVMFAGTFVSFLALLPFALGWWWAPQHSLVRELSAVVLTFLNLAALTNLIPFIELDGYFMLSHALDMMDLRKQAQQFWRDRLKRVVVQRGERLSRDYDRRSQKIYLIYGLCSDVFTVVFLAYIAFFWWVTVVRLLLKGIVPWNLVPALALVLLQVVLSSKKIRAWLQKARSAKA